MKFFKIALITILCVIAITSFSQSVKNKSAKFDELIFPKMPVSGIKQVKISMFPGDGMDISQNDLFERNGLGKKLQAKQDKMNGIGSNWVTFQSYELVSAGQDVTIEIAFGKFQHLGQQLKDHKIVCVRDDGKIDKEDIKECPAYYYEVSYNLPVVVKISEPSGKILNADHFEDQGVTTFGYDDSGLTGYLKTSDLDAAFNKPGTSKSIEKNAFKNRLNEVGEFLQENFYFQQEKIKIDISSGGGKLNYDDLNEAQGLAINALENLQQPASEEQLTKAIAIWNSALEEANMNDKKARINRRLAGFVALNKAKAYYYIQDFEKSLASVDEAKKYLRHSSNLAHMESVDSWANKVSIASSNAKTTEINRSLVSGKPIEAPDMINLVKVKEKNAPYAFIQPGSKYEMYKEEYLEYRGPSADPNTAPQEELDLASVLTGGMTESGTISWEDRMQFAGNLGYYITIAYTNNETIPVEICELEMLNTLLANNAKISSLPKQIGLLKNLKTLNLASNSLTSLPEEVGELENLKKLNLSKNQLTALPASLSQCKNLKTLIIKGNNIALGDIDKIQAALPNCKIKL